MLNQFNSNSRRLNRVVPKVNINNLTNNDLTGSLQNIEIPTNTKFQSKTRSNPNPIKLVNSKTKIYDFHQEILQHSARIKRIVADELHATITNSENSALHTLVIYNKLLDYGTETPSPDNFEVLENGLHVPGFFDIEQVGNNIVVTFTSIYLINLDAPPAQFSVVGRMVDVNLATEISYDLIIDTEDNNDIII